MEDFIELGTEDVDTVTEGSDPLVADISCNFHWVRPAVQEILDANLQLTYTTGDIHAACEQGVADLWTTSEGFVVTTGETDLFTGERTMLIWLAWAKERGTNLVDKHQDFFIAQAKVGGFVKLETRSAVPELREYFLEQGWQIDTIVYTRDVQ